MASQPDSLPTTSSTAQTKLQRFLNFIKRHLPTILAVLCVIMILIAGLLVYLVVTETFRTVFTCDYLIDRPLSVLDPLDLFSSVCGGLGIQIPGWTIISRTHIVGDIYIPEIGWKPIPIPILPPLRPIDGPLGKIRLFVSWNIVIVFAVISLVLTYVAVKVKTFVNQLMTADGRRIILQNISIYLVIFAVISTLFYFTVVANH